MKNRLIQKLKYQSNLHPLFNYIFETNNEENKCLRPSFVRYENICKILTMSISFAGWHPSAWLEVVAWF